MISGCKLEKAISQYGERVGKKLVFKTMPKRERQRVTTRQPQRKQKNNNNNKNKTGAVYKPVITNFELQSTLVLVFSSFSLTGLSRERFGSLSRFRSSRTFEEKEKRKRKLL